MRLRTRLLLAQAPLALVVAAVAAYALGTIVKLSEKSDAILADNLRSLVAIEHMEAAADDVDALLARGAREDVAPVASVAAALDRFEKEFLVQDNNITEEGERSATDALGAVRTRWRAAVREAAAARERSERERLYFERVRPLARELQEATTRVLHLNRDSMVRKSTSASGFAKEVVQTLSMVSVAALLVAMLTGYVFANQIARPLARLAESARRIGEGDLDLAVQGVTLAPGAGQGEIDTLVREFGRMAEKLRAYRKSTLGELLEATDAAQAAIDSLHDPVIAFNEDGSFRRANEAARAKLALDPNATDPLAPLGTELRAGIVAVRDAVLQGKGPQTPRGLEGSQAVLVGGKPHYLQPLATPIRSEASGAVVGVTVLLRDVTSLRRADELKNDLLATVAHEIKTPLTSLRMAIHLTLEGATGPITAKQEELLAAARDDAERLHAIVEGILSAARIEGGSLVGRRRPVSPRALVEKSVAAQRLAAADKGVTLTAEAVEAPLVAVDEESAVLVLTNMLVNALKHTPQGGRITARAFDDEGGVRFEVADTGPGIAPEHRPRLFEKFYRVPGSPSGGTGLGLAIARDIVFAHEGEIGVESTVGEGSRFWFRLPSVKVSS